MSENKLHEGWPVCPVCGDSMVLIENKAVCMMLKDGVVVPKHQEELPPLGVCVSDVAGATSKFGGN